MKMTRVQSTASYLDAHRSLSSIILVRNDGLPPAGGPWGTLLLLFSRKSELNPASSLVVHVLQVGPGPQHPECLVLGPARRHDGPSTAAMLNDAFGGRLASLVTIYELLHGPSCLESAAELALLSGADRMMF